MRIKVPEAEILRTPIKIEKLSLWNRTGSGFIMNFEFHGFQKGTYFQKNKKKQKNVFLQKSMKLKIHYKSSSRPVPKG